MDKPKCEKCGAPLSLTPKGKLRKNKRFCSAKCQQAAIATARREAYSRIAPNLQKIEDALAEIRYSLMIMGWRNV